MNQQVKKRTGVFLLYGSFSILGIGSAIALVLAFFLGWVAIREVVVTPLSKLAEHLTFNLFVDSAKHSILFLLVLWIFWSLYRGMRWWVQTSLKELPNGSSARGLIVRSTIFSVGLAIFGLLIPSPFFSVSEANNGLTSFFTILILMLSGVYQGYRTYNA